MLCFKLKQRLIGMSFFWLSLFVVPLFSQDFFVPGGPMSIAVGDFDIDGDLDIVTGHNTGNDTGWSNGLYFLENLGNCNFATMDSMYIYGGQTNIQVGLINNDNIPDVLAKYQDSDTEITYATIVTDINQDSIQFYPYEKLIEPHGITGGIDYNHLLDYDGDNDLDIAYAYYYWDAPTPPYKPYGVVGLLTNLGDGVFSQPKEYLTHYPNGFSVGNLNNDGYDDAISGGKIIDLYFGSDTGFTIDSIKGTGGYAKQIYDMNNDNWDDIIVLEWNGAGQDKNIFVYYNLGGGVFNADFSDSIHITQGGSYICIGDLNNDHYADIVFNSAIFYPNGPYDTDSTYVILNYGNGNFGKVTGYYTGIYSEKSLIADMNGDGYNDILTTSHAHTIYPGKGIVHLSINDGSGHFGENGSVIEELKTIVPENYTISTYPNPFNPSVTISYTMPIISHRTTFLCIYDITGRKLRDIKLNKASGTLDLDFKDWSTGQYIICLNLDNMVKISTKVHHIK